jgi:hypothetical protein
MTVFLLRVGCDTSVASARGTIHSERIGPPLRASVDTDRFQATECGKTRTDGPRPSFFDAELQRDGQSHVSCPADTVGEA